MLDDEKIRTKHFFDFLVKNLDFCLDDTTSNIELTLLLQPENTDGLEVFRLDPAMNLGTWKRYRFTMKTVSMIPNLLVVFAANSQGQNFLAIDNVFLR